MTTQEFDELTKKSENLLRKADRVFFRNNARDKNFIFICEECRNVYSINWDFDIPLNEAEDILYSHGWSRKIDDDGERIYFCEQHTLAVTGVSNS